MICICIGYQGIPLLLMQEVANYDKKLTIFFLLPCLSENPFNSIRADPVVITFS